MTETERAWAAGFFDGEGNTHFRLISGKYRTIQIGIPQEASNREVLDKFRSIMRIGKVNGPYEQSESNIVKNGKPFCVYTASGKNVQIIIDAIWEYLGAAKRQQAREAISQFTGLIYKEDTEELTHEQTIENRKLFESLDNLFNPPKRRSNRISDEKKIKRLLS